MGKKRAIAEDRRQQLKKVASHPIRLRILGVLHGHSGPRTQREIGRELSLSTAAVHYHLKKLLEAGLLQFKGTRPGPNGITEKLYSYQRGAWKEVSHRDQSEFLLDFTFACIRELHREAAELIKGGRCKSFVAGCFGSFASPEEIKELKSKVWGLLWDFDKAHQKPIEGKTRPVAITCAILPSQGTGWTGTTRVFDNMLP